MCRVTANSLQHEEQHSQVPRVSESRETSAAAKENAITCPRPVMITGEDVVT